MSKTYKDIPWKHRSKENDWRYEYRDSNDALHSIKIAGVKTKKKRRKDTEYHWMTTPGWWIHQLMTKPQRRAGKLWEREAAKVTPEDLEELDTQFVGRKPHVYYW